MASNSNYWFEKGLNIINKHQNAIEICQIPSDSFIQVLLKIEDCFKNVDANDLEGSKQLKYRFDRGWICSLILYYYNHYEEYEKSVNFGLIGFKSLDGLNIRNHQSKSNKEETIKILQDFIVQLQRNISYSLGNAYTILNDLDFALFYYQKGADLNHIPSIYNVASTYNNKMFGCYNREKAEEYYIRAANTDFDGIGNPRASLLLKSIASSYSGNIYIERKEYEKALEMYQRAFVGEAYWGAKKDEIKFYLEARISDIKEILNTNDFNTDSKIANNKEFNEKYGQLFDKVASLVDEVNNLKSDLALKDKDIQNLKERVGNIEERVDDLTNYVLQQQIDIEESLNNAITKNNESLVEKITSELANDITNHLVIEIKEKNTESFRDEEEKLLKTKFTDSLWNKLEDNSKDFLITGKVLYRMLNNSNKVDYSSICLLITKAVDNELHKYLFTNFYNYVTKRGGHLPNFFYYSNSDDLIEDKDFTLGSVKYFCCQSNTGYSSSDKETLHNYCQDKLFIHPLNKNETIKNLIFISNSAEKITEILLRTEAKLIKF